MLKNKRIIFFIGSLRTGGKERRLIELIIELKIKTNYEILLILAYDEIEYKYFYKYNIYYVVIDKKPKNKSIVVFFQLNKIIREFKPDIIHTWGSMETFYMIPIALKNKIPLINSQIADSKPQLNNFSFENLINKINFIFSSVILANSYAGIEAYKVNKFKKSHVIYNGFNKNRIESLISKKIIKKMFGINTKYIVGMVASFSDRKDYETYILSANEILRKRNDITFLCVGSGDYSRYKKMVKNVSKGNILFLGQQQNIESIMNVCDVGVLMSNPNTHGEGISNALMEFMALGKPVIANSSGGNKEIINNGISGFIIKPRSKEELSDKLLFILNNQECYNKMSKKCKERIKTNFTMDKMVKSFIKLYS